MSHRGGPSRGSRRMGRGRPRIFRNLRPRCVGISDSSVRTVHLAHDGALPPLYIPHAQVPCAFRAAESTDIKGHKELCFKRKSTKSRTRRAPVFDPQALRALLTFPTMQPASCAIDGFERFTTMRRAVALRKTGASVVENRRLSRAANSMLENVKAATRFSLRESPES